MVGRCISSICWFEVDEVALIGAGLVHEAIEKVWFIREGLTMTQSQQKSYVGVRRKDFDFDVEWLDLLEDFTYEECHEASK